MWSSLLGLSLLIALNPILLGIILLIISRPRPVQNLFAFWVGALIVNLPIFLIPLALLHSMPAFEAFAQNFGTAESNSGVQAVPLGTGVVAFSIAAAITARASVRQRTKVAATGGDTSTVMLDSKTPIAQSRPLGGAKEAAIKAVSELRRQLGRLQSLWDNGSPGVAFVFGMMYLPSLSLVLLINTTIMASGAGIGEQVTAVITFVVGFLAVLEITLLSYRVAPAKTEVVLRPVHAWARDHNRKILVTFFLLIGFWQLARGFGIM